MSLKFSLAVQALLIACLTGLPAGALGKELSKSDKRWLEQDVAAIITKEELGRAISLLQEDNPKAEENRRLRG